MKCFFVISGFLITSILLKEYGKSGGIDLKRFYIRRAWRIFPAFYAYLLVTAALSVGGLFLVPMRDFAIAGAYLTNFQPAPEWRLAHMWSLAVEEQFYLLWPVLIAAFGLSSMRFCGAALILAPACRVALLSIFGYESEAPIKWFPAICDALAAGCLLAGYRQRLWDARWYRAAISSPLFLPLAAASILALNRLRGSHPLLGWAIFESLLVFAIAGTIDHTVRFPPVWLNWTPISTVGAMSYSLYLWQQLFLNRHDQAAWYAAFPVSLVLTCMAAAGSYYLIEQPCLRLRDKPKSAASIPATLKAA